MTSPVIYRGINQDDVSVNLSLAKKYGLSKDSVIMISSLHQQRQVIFEALQSGVFKPSKRVNSMLESIEESLQLQWFNKVDMKYYRFWDIPKCDCPKVDNTERYPYGNYIISENCKFHQNLSRKSRALGRE